MRSIGLQYTIEADLATFDQDAFKAQLARTFEVDPSTVELRVRAASILVDVVIRTTDAVSAERVLTKANQHAADPAVASTDLGQFSVVAAQSPTLALTAVDAPPPSPSPSASTDDGNKYSWVYILMGILVLVGLGASAGLCYVLRSRRRMQTKQVGLPQSGVAAARAQASVESVADGRTADDIAIDTADDEAAKKAGKEAGPSNVESRTANEIGIDVAEPAAVEEAAEEAGPSQADPLARSHKLISGADVSAAPRDASATAPEDKAEKGEVAPLA